MFKPHARRDRMKSPIVQFILRYLRIQYLLSQIMRKFGLTPDQATVSLIVSGTPGNLLFSIHISIIGTGTILDYTLGHVPVIQSHNTLWLPSAATHQNMQLLSKGVAVPPVQLMPVLTPDFFQDVFEMLNAQLNAVVNNLQPQLEGMVSPVSGQQSEPAQATYAESNAVAMHLNFKLLKTLITLSSISVCAQQGPNRQQVGRLMRKHCADKKAGERVVMGWSIPDSGSDKSVIKCFAFAYPNPAVVENGQVSVEFAMQQAIDSWFTRHQEQLLTEMLVLTLSILEFNQVLPVEGPVPSLH